MPRAPKPVSKPSKRMDNPPASWLALDALVKRCDGLSEYQQVCVACRMPMAEPHKADCALLEAHRVLGHLS